MKLYIINEDIFFLILTLQASREDFAAPESLPDITAVG